MALRSPLMINPAVSHNTASVSPIIYLKSLRLCGGHQLVRMMGNERQSCRRGIPKAFFGLENEPVVKEALREPIAFFGGVFAGLLRLDLNEDPLKEWIERTSEAAKVQVEEQESIQEDGPEEIKIE